ncbi:hypothetical protein ABD624_14360 [Avibacterium paragallinarum]
MLWIAVNNKIECINQYIDQEIKNIVVYEDTDGADVVCPAPITEITPPNFYIPEGVCDTHAHIVSADMQQSIDFQS